jgi:hypothetical protein
VTCATWARLSRALGEIDGSDSAPCACIVDGAWRISGKRLQDSDVNVRSDVVKNQLTSHLIRATHSGPPFDSLYL